MFTAKTTDLAEAKKIALRQYDLIRALEGQNAYVDGKRFGQVKPTWVGNFPG